MRFTWDATQSTWQWTSSGLSSGYLQPHLSLLCAPVPTTSGPGPSEIRTHAWILPLHGLSDDDSLPCTCPRPSLKSEHRELQPDFRCCPWPDWTPWENDSGGCSPILHLFWLVQAGVCSDSSPASFRLAFSFPRSAADHGTKLPASGRWQIKNIRTSENNRLCVCNYFIFWIIIDIHPFISCRRGNK